MRTLYLAETSPTLDQRQLRVCGIAAIISGGRDKQHAGIRYIIGLLLIISILLRKPFIHGQIPKYADSVDVACALIMPSGENIRSQAGSVQIRGELECAKYVY